MLKLQRSPNTQMISITLREKGVFVSQTFIWALSIAAALHLLGFLIFHITPIKLSFASTRFAPVEVGVEGAAAIGQEAVAKIEEPLRRFNLLLVPPFTKVEGDRLPDSKPKRSDLYPSVTSFENTSFDKNQSLFFLLPAAPFEAPKARAPAVSWQLIGMAAEKKLRSRPKASEMPRIAANAPLKETPLTFDIKVDLKVGKIFWYSPRQPIRRSKLKKSIDKFMQGFRFEPEPQGFVADGTIEILLSSSLPEGRL